MRVYTKTFGCRVNQYETQALRERLGREAGSVDAEGFEDADVCVVNTCTVTAEADREALALLRRIGRRNPAARLFVTGCLVSRDAALVRAAAPHAQLVGNAEKASLPALLGCAPAPLGGVSGLAGRSRAFVKVQDGCNMSCAFCVIPSIRPELSSKSWPELLDEVRGLVDAGKPEIVLCGIRLGRYLSRDEAGRRVDLVCALERLLEVPGEFRLRLSSLEITDATDRLFALMAASGGRLCPSLHAPLQSGSETVLRRMKRWYSAEFYRRRADAFRAQVPKAALFADVMTGFPGETDAEHEESLRFAQTLPFDGLHVFRYSRRPGTAAARLSPVPEAVIARRAAEWRALDERLRAAFAARVVGRERTVVPELAGDAGLTEDFLEVGLPERLPPGLHRLRLSEQNLRQA